MQDMKDMQDMEDVRDMENAQDVQDMESMTERVRHEIETLRLQKKRLLIAIDGRCAAGKTTLAAYLQNVYDCNVFPMDHFFLRPEQRTSERLNEPGGNVDYERFLKEVMEPLRQGGDFAYRPYACQRLDFCEAITIQESSINIVEGSYSCHPTLWDYYDLRIFLTVEPEEQLRRIIDRNGAERAVDFKDKWIPLEERYFSAFNIMERCDFCLSLATGLGESS